MKDDIVLKDLLLTNYHYTLLSEKQENIDVYAESFETTAAKYTVVGQKQLSAGQVRQCKSKELAENYEKYKEAVSFFSEKCFAYINYFARDGKRSAHKTGEELSENKKNVLMAFRNVIFTLGFEKKERTAMMFNAMMEKEKRWNDTRAVNILIALTLPCFLKQDQDIRDGVLGNQRVETNHNISKEAYATLENTICRLYEETYLRK